MNETPSSTSALSEEEKVALNKHGVFFKKKILQALSEIPKTTIVAEELGVSFGGTRAIDILVQDKTGDHPLLFVFECKRAYTSQKRWLFFEDFHPRYRLYRRVNPWLGVDSVFVSKSPSDPPVCSEGYELRVKEKKKWWGTPDQRDDR
jgi:hypothetical protein